MSRHTVHPATTDTTTATAVTARLPGGRHTYLHHRPAPATTTSTDTTTTTTTTTTAATSRWPWSSAPVSACCGGREGSAHLCRASGSVVLESTTTTTSTTTEPTREGM